MIGDYGCRTVSVTIRVYSIISCQLKLVTVKLQDKKFVNRTRSLRDGYGIKKAQQPFIKWYPDMK